jgi:hypothetical protein
VASTQAGRGASGIDCASIPKAEEGMCVNHSKEVKPPSPNDRFMIAFRSSELVFETGLLRYPSEKEVAHQP